jgi:hypothetical protein
MKQRYSQEGMSRNGWIALGLLLLGISLAEVLQISRSFQPKPFPSFKDQITVGMTIEEVKEILGEPERRAKRIAWTT